MFFLSHFGIAGHLLISACPVTSHSHLSVNSTHLFSQLLHITDDPAHCIYSSLTLIAVIVLHLVQDSPALFSTLITCCQPRLPLTNLPRLISGKLACRLSPALNFSTATLRSVYYSAFL